jgi:hypothetical protein
MLQFFVGRQQTFQNEKILDRLICGTLILSLALHLAEFLPDICTVRFAIAQACSLFEP